MMKKNNNNKDKIKIAIKTTLLPVPIAILSILESPRSLLPEESQQHAVQC